MGMLATSINSIALQSALENIGVKATHLSGLAIDPICNKMSRKRAVSAMEDGHVVIISGGTGNPYFTTDSGAALRGIEIGAEVILKGTRVDGIYTADPEKDPLATKYDELSFDEAYQMNLNIMDLTAFTLCKENNLPIIVFDMNTDGNLEKIIAGDKIGTIVKYNL
jgi:uridylate kinase